MLVFDQFYDLFLKNNMKGLTYRITLLDGTTLVGVATTGSMVDIKDPDPKFQLEIEGKKFSIPFQSVYNIEEDPGDQ